jgi:hypothetical protein
MATRRQPLLALGKALRRLDDDDQHPLVRARLVLLAGRPEHRPARADRLTYPIRTDDPARAGHHSEELPVGSRMRVDNTARSDWAKPWSEWRRRRDLNPREV